jgi:hypothetical protein
MVFFESEIPVSGTQAARSAVLFDQSPPSSQAVFFSVDYNVVRKQAFFEIL